MPVILSLVLTNQLPINTYTASVVTSGSIIADGLGNQITFLELTCSYSRTASIQTSWEESSSFASQSIWAISSSFASQSFSATSASWASASHSSSYSTTASFAESASWASTSVSASGYVSASSIFGGLTTILYVVSASGATDYVTMSFANGILTTVS